MRESVKLVHGSLDEDGDDIIARGVIDPKSLNLIQRDDYQREVLPITTQSSLIKAFKSNGKIPDVTLGMRGGEFHEQNGFFYLKDPVFVIDGLQRISTALHLMGIGEKVDPHLGAVVHFNTNPKMEAELFRILNTCHQKLSPNVLIRNMRDSNTTVDMIYNLCFDKSFVMYDRVAWQQRMRRTELISALTLMKVNGMLHSSFGPGLSSKMSEAAPAMEKTMKNCVGRNTMRDNIKTFFEVVDGAWGIRNVAFKQSAPYLRSSFLLSLALVLAHHTNFWDGNRKLTVSTDLRAKIRMFPVTDPQVQQLASAGGSAKGILYRLILDHLNSGKRTRRMVPFKDSDPINSGIEAEGEEDDRSCNIIGSKAVA